MRFILRGAIAYLLAVYTPSYLVAQPQPATNQAQPPKPEEDPPLPKFVDMVVPTAEELLRGKPVDWVVLLNADTLVVEPLPNRPNTLKVLQQNYEDFIKTKSAGLNPEERRQKLHELLRIQLSLIDGGEEPDYQLEYRYIDRIVYFEDLVLKRASLLMDAGELPSAYELLMFLDRTRRGWAGFDLYYHRFLFLEANRLAKQGLDEAALAQYERLFALEPKYAQLHEQLGAAIDRQIAAAMQAEDFRRARHFWSRLERRIPGHLVVSRWRTQWTEQATQAVAAAREAFAAGQHRAAVDWVERAALVWPDLPGLKDAHRELTARYQIVKTGVVRLPGTPTGYPAETRDDERRRHLCELPLFEPDRLQDGLVRYRSAFIESWEPRDLGRELRFQLRPRRAAWESRPVVTAGMIVDSFTARLAAGRQAGDDRWTANLRAIESESPWDWRLTLSQIPLRVEGWLRVPVPLTPEAAAWNADLHPSTWDAPSEQRFRLVERTDDRAVYQRTRAEADGVAARHVAEIREHRYDDWDRLLQGLNRGEVDVAPVVEFRDLAALQQDSRFFVLPYALPRSHVVLVNPRSPVARNGPLRRALLHALPREELLRQHVLEGANQFGRVVNSPFASTIYAYDGRLAQPEYSSGLALSLATTAKKEQGGELPVLKLRAPDDAVAARVLPDMLRHWKRAGLTIEILPDEPGAANDWDLLYATVRLTEPYVDLWTLIAPDGAADWRTLQIYPDWLREQLLELERTVDWTAAVRQLQRIQAEFLVEARWLPLWEVDEHLLVRRRITGLLPQPEQPPMHAYHNIERWTVQSWYPTETP